VYIQGPANFLSNLVGGLQLLSLSILVGSLFWGWFVLRVSRPGTATPASAWRSCMRVLRAGALALAVRTAVFIDSLATLLSVDVIRHCAEGRPRALEPAAQA
jgi:hypothetical protein